MENTNEIRFYNDPKNPFFPLSNYYMMKTKETLAIGKKKTPFKSIEHYFQFRKFSKNHKDYAREIRNVKTAHQSRLLASKGRIMKRDWRKQSTTKLIFDNPIYSDVQIRPDWDVVRDKIMRKAIYQKFKHNQGLRKLLLSTGNKTLIEDSPTDLHYGIGKNGNGLNMLGQILMETREKLSKEH